MSNEFPAEKSEKGDEKERDELIEASLSGMESGVSGLGLSKAYL